MFGNNLKKPFPNFAFRMMKLSFDVKNFFSDSSKCVLNFEMKEGQKVVDYGCGTGIMVPRTSELIGEKGTLFAVDIHPLAIECIENIIKKQNLKNIKPIKIDIDTDISTKIEEKSIDRIMALDMFHHVANKIEFLQRISKILKDDGFLFLDNGHQKRSIVLKAIDESNCFIIKNDRNDSKYLKLAKKIPKEKN